MTYRLQDLIDMEHFQNLQDRLNEIYSFPSSIIDNEGNILTATAWQDICTQFHRKNIDSKKLCIQSDQYILSHLHEANPAVSYRCPHGLVDNAAPIIIEGIHYGNFFTGQFFLNQPDMDFFRSQAKKYGFDEAAYLSAVKRVPVWTQGQLNSYLFFIKGLIAVISESGLKKLKEIESRKQIQESEEWHRTILQAAIDGFWLADMQGRLLEVNDAYCRMSGYSALELLTMGIADLDANETADDALAHRQKVMALGQERFESCHRRKDGSIFYVEVSVQYQPSEGGRLFAFLRDITERKRAEQDLLKSAERHRVLFENAGDAIYIHDAEARMLAVNPTACKLLCYSHDELMSMTIDQVDTPEESLFAPERIAKLMERGYHTFETMHRRKDGSSIPIEVNARRIFWDGRLAMMSICRDITERKRAEEALIRSERKWRNILVETPQIGISLSPQAKIIFANIHFLKLTGWKEKEVLGKDWFDMFIPENVREEVRSVFHTTMNQKDLLGYSSYENEIVTRRGERRTVAWSNVLTKDVQGNAVDVTSLGIDRTESLRAKKLLQESEEKYRSMMEAMEDAAYICSSDLHIEYQNAAMIKRIGRDASGEHCYKGIHGFDEKCPGCIHERIMRGEVVRSEVVSPIDQKTYHISNSPIYHSDGSVSKLSIFRDITETKKMAERLDQAQRMEAIGALAGGIAHDFNNILYPIIGMSEMLLEDLPTGSPEYQNVEVIFKAAKRAGDLVRQILSFSRQTEHQKIPVRIQHILKEVLNLTRSTIPSNIEITQFLQSDCDLVMADPTQIHQIAMNLITNAYHAVEKAGGSISVQLKELVLPGKDWAGAALEPGKYAVITVSDTGHGIDPAVMGKIFEPYFTTKEVGKGTGLGLSVVHGIVKDHGGDIRVYSELGQGTAFTVFLPLMKTALETVVQENACIYETGTERILLVDDEEPIARLEQAILERLGYHITTRMSSFDALEAFRANPDAFDLVITDMAMPNMTGDWLAKELKLIKPGVPIILCTGFSTKIDEQTTKANGINGFLMKPVVKSDMAKIIRKVLDEAKR
jgi:PAS domain S-box-containing protein